MNFTGVVLCSALLLSIIAAANGYQQRRCFRCRSRGPLGDCKDTFPQNVTSLLAGGGRGVSAPPCPSGWCGKIIEGDKDLSDYDTATERMCMPRPPSDRQERCDDTKYGHYRKVYLCMCRGDLCNASTQPVAAAAVALLGLITSLLLR